MALHNQNRSYQDDTLLISHFYWESLGLPNYASTMRNVSSRIDDFRAFISRAIRSLNGFTFKYKYNVFTKIVPDMRDFFDSEGELELCADKDFKVVVFKGRITKGQKQFTIPGYHKLSTIYINGTNRQVRVRMSHYLLRELKPINVSDEEENSVLDVLFETADVYLGSVNKRNRLNILRKSRNKVELEVEEPDKEFNSAEMLIVAFNTYTLRMQQKALERLASQPQPHMIPIIDLLQQKKFVKWPDFKIEHPHRYGVLLNQGTPGTDEQREFVQIALGTSDFAVLEGPPGSGKTSTLLEIILNLCITGKRVLMVASTHVAVDNVLERLSEGSDVATNLMDQFGVIPLRIGDEENVSERVKRFTISKRIEEERNRLRLFLGDQKTPTDAQTTLLTALDTSNGDSVIENLVMDSSNFVCGTTIGILKSKLIKNHNYTSSRPPFDYMIIDEASKTTFTEFLVPAIFAEKWIISGDPKQLSPYVDEEFIRTVVSNAPSFSRIGDNRLKLVKEVSLDVFNSVNVENFRKVRGALIVDDDGTPSEMYKSQVERLSSRMDGNKAAIPTIFDLNDLNSSQDNLLLLASRLVIGKKSQIQDFAKYLPPGLKIRGEVTEMLKRREAAITEIADIDGDSQTWEGQISWRLNRAYEMRGDEKSKEYIKEIELLTPYLLDDQENENSFRLSRGVESDLRKIRRTFYPSIIEMLQKGVSEKRRDDESEAIPIYEGLPSADFDRRHILLTYQHRMHPEISNYARNLFYEEKALLSGPEMTRIRSWGYTQEYRRHMVWIDRKTKVYSNLNSHSNTNEFEVSIVKDELKKFLNWAKHNRNSGDRNWNIALLTFYRGQERALSKMMREMTGTSNHRYFHMWAERVDIEVCTVDRFQGQEADMVFLSMVRRRGVGFLDNRNRMNVAITRARYQMVIVGDKTPFKNCKIEFLRKMANDIEGPI